MHWRSAVEAPEHLAAQQNFQVIRFVLPCGSPCASDGQRIFVSPSVDLQLEGLRLWAGIAIALLTRARIDHRQPDVWLLAAELAAPARTMTLLGPLRVMRAQRQAPSWFLRDWAVVRANHVVRPPVPSSGRRRII